MNKHQLDFDMVLAECLDSIENQQRSVADCLAQYPDYAEDLAVLLRLAEALPHAQQVRPSLAFRQHGPARLKRRLETSRRPPLRHAALRQSVSMTPPQASFAWGKLAVRLALPILAVAAFASASAMVAKAADGAVPGDSLYLVDLAVEDLELNFAATPQERLGLQLQYADERIGEAEQLAQQGDANHLEEAVTKYEELVAEARAQLPAANGNSEQALQQSLSVHEARLLELLDKVPEQARSGIERAIAASQYGQDRRNSNQSGGDKAEDEDHPNGSDEQTDNLSEDKPGSRSGNGNSQGGVKPNSTPGGWPTDYPGSGSPGFLGEDDDSD